MDITRAIQELLQSDDAFALADALWLLEQNVVSLEENKAEKPVEVAKPAPISKSKEQVPSPSIEPQPAPPVVDTDIKKPPQPIKQYLRTLEEKDALRFRTPSARALPESALIARALRSLRRRMPSRHNFILDEEESATQSAESKRLSPVFKPAVERWLELALLIDDSAGMLIWRDALVEFRSLCERAGVFRDVRVWRFNVSTQTVRALNNQTVRSLKELHASDARRLTLVASSGVGPSWRTNLLIEAIAELGKKQPVALLQMLPERLWERSAIARYPNALWCHLGADAPGALNPNYRVAPMRESDLLLQVDLDADTNSLAYLQLPLLTFDADLFQAYTHLIAHPGTPNAPGLRLAFDPAAVATARAKAKLDAAAQVADANTAEITVPLRVAPDDLQKRLTQFKQEASANAIGLLGLLWGVPLLLPVIRLVQRALQPGRSGNAELSELFFSGLVRRKSSASVIDPNRVEFDFYTPLREWLRRDSRLDQVMHVKHVLSDYLQARYGQDYDFLAGVSDSEDAESDQTFAELRGLWVQRLGVARQTENVALPVELPNEPALITAVTPPGNLISYSGLTPFSKALNFHATAPCELDCVMTGDGFVVTPTRLTLDAHLTGVVTISRRVQSAGTFLGKLTCTPVAPATGGPFVYDPAIFAIDQKKSPLEGKRILWMDDNPQYNNSQQARLVSLGALVTTVTTTENALALLGEGNFDGLISDFGRKGEVLAGLKLLDILDEHGPFIPSAIYSQAGPEFEAEAKNFGAIAYSNNFDEVIIALNEAVQSGRHLTQPPIWRRESTERLSLAEVMSRNELQLLWEMPGKNSELDTWLSGLINSSSQLELKWVSRFVERLTAAPYLKLTHGNRIYEENFDGHGIKRKRRKITFSYSSSAKNQKPTFRLDIGISGALDFTSRQKQWLESAVQVMASGSKFGKSDLTNVSQVMPVTAPGKLALPGFTVGIANSSAVSLNFNVASASCSLDFTISGAGFSVAPTPLNLVVGTPGTVVVMFEGSSAGNFGGSLTCTPAAPAVGGPFVYDLAVVVNPVHAKSKRPLEGKRILWVDDNFDKKKAELAILKATGVLDVHNVSTTREANNAVRLGGVDAVISDLGRKGEKLAGLTLVNELDTTFPSIPAAIYSMSAKPLENQARQFGAITCTNNFNDVLEAFAVYFLTNSSGRAKRIWPRAALQRLQVALNLSMDSNEMDAITFKEVLARSSATNQSERLQLINQVLKALLDRKTVQAIVVSAPEPNSTLITRGNIVSKPNNEGFVCISVIRENRALLLSTRQNQWVYEALCDVVQAQESDVFSKKATEQDAAKQSQIASWFASRTLTDQEFVEACWRMFAVAYSKIDCFKAPEIGLLEKWAHARATVAVGLKARFEISDRVYGPFSAAERVTAFASYASMYSYQNSDAAKFFEALNRDETSLLNSALEGEITTDWIEPYGYCHIDSKATSPAMKVILESLGIGTVEIQLPHIGLNGVAEPPPYGNLVVGEFGPIQSAPRFLVCAFDDDVAGIVEQVATVRVSQLEPRTYKDIESVIGDLKPQLHDLKRPIFIHTFPPLVTYWFKKIEAELHDHGVVLVDGTTLSNVSGFSSLGVDVFSDNPLQNMSEGAQPESVAVLILDSAYAKLSSQFDFARKNVFFFGEASLKNDLAEFARELRDIVEAKTYLTDPQDTHKNKFGRYATRNRRALSARVEQLPFLDGEYLVTLQVNGEDHWPLKGEVIFHLDQSFAQYGPLPPTVTVTASDNSASIQLTAWGAFTVGVLCDDGLTNLELDLGDLTDAPPEFWAAEVAPTARELRVSDLMVAIDRKNLRLLLRAKPEVMATLEKCDPALLPMIESAAMVLIEQDFRCTAKREDLDSLVIRLDPQNFDWTEKLINAKKLTQFVAPAELEQVPTIDFGDSYVFISHAAHDRAMAHEIERGLAAYGIQTFMFAGDIESGSQIMETINAALARSTHFLSLLTPVSIGREFVRQELNAATHFHIQRKLKMILLGANGFSAKQHLHKDFPFLATFPVLEFKSIEVTVPLLAAEILHLPSESKSAEAHAAPIEANQHGLSETAFAIVSHFCRDSDDGIESRTVATEFNELRRLTDSDQAEMEAAIIELKDDIRDLRGSARRALSACPTLFARYDHLFHDWWPELDAVQIGTYLVGEAKIYHSVEQLSQKLSLPPRRVNPAAQWLMMHNLCLSADAAPASNFLNKRLRANGPTREFLREYGERV